MNMNFVLKDALFLCCHAFVKTLFPSRCLFCKTSIDDESGVLCFSCRDALPVHNGSGCRCCGRMFASSAAPGHLCGNCLAHPPSFTSVQSYGFYEEPFVSLLRQLKYGKGTAILPLVEELSEQFSSLLPKKTDIILPVPLHRHRLRCRGYNQSLLLARAMFPQHRTIINPNVLKRVENTVSQTGLSRKERRKNLRNAFVVRLPEYVRKKTVCLVDDIYTTGSTMEECAKVLVKSGACDVYGITVVRTRLVSAKDFPLLEKK